MLILSKKRLTRFLSKIYIFLTFFYLTLWNLVNILKANYISLKYTVFKKIIIRLNWILHLTWTAACDCCCMCLFIMNALNLKIRFYLWTTKSKLVLVAASRNSSIKSAMPFAPNITASAPKKLMSIGFRGVR